MMRVYEMMLVIGALQQQWWTMFFLGGSGWLMIQNANRAAVRVHERRRLALLLVGSESAVDDEAPVLGWDLAALADLG
jgi:hypothetical protein